MTVTYTAEVATCRGFGCFLKLLLRWRASIYKLVWLDLLLFLSIYYTLSCIYRFILDDEQKKTFEAIVAYCSEYSDLIPLSFVLGFYVSIVMTRWWNQYMVIPWPDSIAVFVSATIHGNDERGRLMRRTIVRYVCVCLTLVLAMVSPRVKKRFPTLEHFVETGLLLENELVIFQRLNAKFPKPSKHWLPIVWASSIVTRARKEGRIRDDFAVKTLIDELNKFRGLCGNLMHYDTISVPLVYTQVVTLAVYTYFLTSVMGRQWLQNSSKSMIDYYFPVFTTLQFFFYMGWLKVAETLINPFGEDDDDFEVNWIIDRNLQVSYLIVDEMHHEHPELIRDQYWDEIFPTELPYTAATQPFREEHPQPSTAGIQLSAAQQELQPSSVRIDEMAADYQQKFHSDLADDAASGIHFTATGKMSRSATESGKIARSASRVSNRDRTLSGGSTPSIIGGSLTRVNSVTSVLKRLFSKEDRPDGGTSAGTKTPGRLASSSSAASLQNRATAGGGSMRIGVIKEEADEQMTLTSMKSEKKPHVQSIFSTGPPPASAPVAVPGMEYSRNEEIFSCSAPLTGVSLESNVVGSSNGRSAQRVSQSARSSITYEPATSYVGSVVDDLISSRSSSLASVNSDDEFTKLKTERERQRRERIERRLARSISGHTNLISRQSRGSLDNEHLLLSELANTSRLSMARDDSDDKRVESDRL
ncbi:bestrophin-4 isoform X2 [Frieseomelitta varia]|uniref:bestrophin-4 isoform X2 n=1 Tax=Frieseomelitta varia TaxID=561572 RepID=UPI001CB6B490|nr:bestrophin-4 isoform X2 [Frieseomelitta varia]XP_043528625.1 bestrophin-4 isoform X2 [Frieseomelitta varia]XP_043528626.1 bestrophin-4 isoform X2 [Frieseomelitta varia]XP_043528627.1 bestrophin-4 isoform X2 [Frieseomelitta varia]XP_043528628.1 bestrophin-4 isoform X2 [Frieseomelitta varia]XP_043528629.1 bestrophin-4 isoform X2 [Frieseomelitta varia]